MRLFRLISRRRVIAFAALGVGSAAVTLALATGALAVFPDSDVASYAACLNTAGGAAGTFSQVAVGDSPAKACSANQTLVHLSGGDITAVRTPTGSGLSGGTDNGAASLTLDSTDCSDGGVLKWSSAGSAWACGVDNNTTYSGSDFALSNQSCPSGQFVTGINSTGEVTCAAPLQTFEAQGSVDLPDGGPKTTVATLALPAGTYFVSARMWVANVINDTHWGCALHRGLVDGPVFEGQDVLPSTGFGVFDTEDTGVAIASFPLQGVVHFEGPNIVTLTCATGVDTSQVLNAKITALRVGE